VQRPEDETDTTNEAPFEGDDAAALHEKAAALMAEDRLPEAERVYREIVRRVKKALGAGNPGHGAALYELSRLLSAQSKHSEAEGLLRRALAVFAADPGAGHPSYGQALVTLASVLAAQDKFKEAEGVLREGLEAQRGALGGDHLLTGPTLTNLAITLVQEQRLEEAEPLVIQSLAITEEGLGPGHEDTARILTILAQVQAALGKTEASATARRALDALVAAHGEDHPRVQELRPVLSDIAEPSAEIDALLAEGARALEARDTDHAIAVLAPLVAQARQDGLLPLEASASGMLAQALFINGKKPEAILLVGRALTIAQEAGQEDAIRHFRELLEVMEQTEPAPGIPEAVHTRIQAAIEAAQAGDAPGAVASLEALAEEMERSADLGAEATARIVLGQILQATGQAEAAAVHLRRALTITEQVGDESAASHVRHMLDAARARP
jgi:tetratricopeptide (TPR) repeat protein